MRRLLVWLFSLINIIPLLKGVIMGNIQVKHSRFFNCFNPIKIHKDNRLEIEHVFFNKSKLFISGMHNTMRIRGADIYNCHFQIFGNGNKIEIEEGCKIYNTHVILRGTNSVIHIRSKSTIGSGCLVCMGITNRIDIGHECMFGDEIEIWNTDSHPIFFSDNIHQAINPSRKIQIGNHVWLGKSTVILKGVTIGDDCVCGMRSIVTKDVPDNSLVVGSPARIIKRGISWEREYITI